VLLDEYARLEPNDPRSFRNTISSVLAEPLGIHADHVHAPDGNAGDLDVEATIMSARSILLLASGKSLADAAGGPAAIVRARTPVLSGVWTVNLRTDTSWKREV